VTAFAPNLKFIDTHSNPDTECDKLAPDVGVYPIDNQPQGDTKTDFSKMELFIEFKIADTSDPFSDPEDPLKPQEGDFHLKRNRTMLGLFVVNWPPMPLLTRGVNFAFTPSVYLYAESMQGSFVGTVMARPLPGASIISNSPNFSLASFGVTHTLIVLSRGTTHPFHQRH
jgi:hypothetical protein